MPTAPAAPFPAYSDFAPRVPVQCVTLGDTGFIHRYYDSSPFSPSGRYMAVTRLPFEDRLPQPGDVAQIVVIDLETGETRTVAETRGWDVQLGAQLQWGADDRTLLYSDVELQDWMPYGVRHDLQSGNSRLLVSLAQIVAAAVPPLPVARERGDFFGFHVKWNPPGTRLMLALRWLPRSLLPWKRKRRYGAKHVITMNADGSDIRVAVSAERWAQGGHHPNWCPDGEHVLMNLNTRGDGLRFARLALDGSSCETLVPTVPGSGHPTLHPDGRHLLTDAYVDEPLAFGDGTAPLRLVDLRSGSETQLVRIAFNACPEAKRRVYVADLADILRAG